jgi:hypothetical protein
MEAYHCVKFHRRSSDKTCSSLSHLSLGSEGIDDQDDPTHVLHPLSFLCMFHLLLLEANNIH